jgi:hypothetical protein
MRKEKRDWLVRVKLGEAGGVGGRERRMAAGETGNG